MPLVAAGDRLDHRRRARRAARRPRRRRDRHAAPWRPQLVPVPSPPARRPRLRHPAAGRPPGRARSSGRRAPRGARRTASPEAPPSSPTTSSTPAAWPTPCWRCSRPPTRRAGPLRERRGDGAARALVRPPRTGRARAASEVEFSVRLLRGMHEASIMGYAAPAGGRGLRGLLGADGRRGRRGLPRRRRRRRARRPDGVGRRRAVGDAHADRAARRGPGGQPVAGGAAATGRVLRGYFDTSRRSSQCSAGTTTVRCPTSPRTLSSGGSSTSMPARRCQGTRACPDSRIWPSALAALAGSTTRSLAPTRRSRGRRGSAFPDGPFAFCYVVSHARRAGQMARRRRGRPPVDGGGARGGRASRLHVLVAARRLLPRAGRAPRGRERCAERARCPRDAPRRRRARVAAVVQAAIGAVHVRRGEHTAALALLTEATDLADSTGSHFWSAEIARQRGEARLGLGDAAGSRTSAARWRWQSSRARRCSSSGPARRSCEPRGIRRIRTLRELLDALGPGAEPSGTRSPPADVAAAAG